jgi:hypothetical protein
LASLPSTSITGSITSSQVDSTIVTTTGSQTLTNKTLTTPTLTTPRFGSAGEIDDTNGNELIKFPTTVASAVNEITVTNAAASSTPSISATGDDTNISLNLVAKGSGTIQAGGVPVVTTTGSQTLTNKTLTSPTITGASGVINNTLTTTTGDIIYASSANTPARLGIGSTGQVLGVSGGVPSWTTPTNSAMVFLTGATFTTVSSVSLPTNTFTTTYDIYKIFFQFSYASSTSVVQIRMRNSGTDVTSSGYFFGGFGTDYNASSTVYSNGSANSAWTIRADANIDRTLWEMTICNPQNSTFGGNGWISGMGDKMGAYSSGLWQNAVSTFDSLSIIKSTSGTFSGKYAVYGIVKS